MAFDITKFIARFAEEARDHLEALNKGLVELERDPANAENLNAIFRSAHTIKGSSRMLKLTAVTEVAHRLEDVLGALREKRIANSRELADLLFKGVDALGAMVGTLAGGGQISADNSALCDALVKASEGGLATDRADGRAAGRLDSAPAAGEPAAPEEVCSAPSPDRQPEQAAEAATETMRVRAGKLDDLIRLMGEIVSQQNKMKQRIVDLGALEREAKRNLERCSRSGNGSDLDGARSIHGGVKQLLSVMRQDKTLQDILTAEFQEKALMMRMVPLSTVFDPLHRLVRDIAGSLAKQVDLEITGSAIELDRKMIEKLGDPLVHMLRNAIDHGIEPPQERQQAGKDQRGQVRIAASYDAGSILIEIRDDGAGISTTRIKEKALARKLFEAEALDAMTDEALFDLIFLPGFSTSAMITDVSGRGVGMDVVKKNIVEDLRGSVKMQSREGRGAAFLIRLPMTLAIMRVLLADCNGVTVGITTQYVVEILKVPSREIIDVADRKAIRLREEFIPVAGLAGLLGAAGNNGASDGMRLMLIVQVGAEKMGFIVDAIVDEEDMVIKPLPDHLKDVRLVSGVTISGRNEIINILNVPAVMDAARAVRDARRVQEAGMPARKANILVVDDSINTREIEKSILESYGYAVTIAGDGIEALERAAKDRFDLVITDVEMPRLDGFSLTERLRADSDYRSVPIVIVTSREKEEDKRRGIAVGADAYIVKGAFDQSNLVETVQNLVGKGAER